MAIWETIESAFCSDDEKEAFRNELQQRSRRNRQTTSRSVANANQSPNTSPNAAGTPDDDADETTQLLIPAEVISMETYIRASEVSETVPLS